MKLDPETKDLTAYLKARALMWAGIEGDIAEIFGKAAVRSAQRDEARDAAIESLTDLRDRLDSTMERNVITQVIALLDGSAAEKGEGEQEE